MTAVTCNLLLCVNKRYACNRCADVSYAFVRMVFKMVVRNLKPVSLIHQLFRFLCEVVEMLSPTLQTHWLCAYFQ
jgi:hypothetical protein